MTWESLRLSGIGSDLWEHLSNEAVERAVVLGGELEVLHTDADQARDLANNVVGPRPM